MGSIWLAVIVVIAIIEATLLCLIYKDFSRKDKEDDEHRDD